MFLLVRVCPRCSKGGTRQPQARGPWGCGRRDKGWAGVIPAPQLLIKRNSSETCRNDCFSRLLKRTSCAALNNHSRPPNGVHSCNVLHGSLDFLCSASGCPCSRRLWPARMVTRTPLWSCCPFHQPHPAWLCCARWLLRWPRIPSSFGILASGLVAL